MRADNGEEYLSQGRLAVEEAERILPRLERGKIRFQIERFSQAALNKFGPVDRIALFIHPDDVEAWRRIRNEYSPV